jgi:hypothetical protein
VADKEGIKFGPTVECIELAAGEATAENIDEGSLATPEEFIGLLNPVSVMADTAADGRCEENLG